jgi:hypothetical protein
VPGRGRHLAGIALVISWVALVCLAPGAAAQSKPDDDAPDTHIDSGPNGLTHDTTPTFDLSATEPGATFECRLDDGPLDDCTTPFTTPELAPGDHVLRVHAQDVSANFDASPAMRSFTVQPDVASGKGPSAACHVTDGKFTPCPDGRHEWGDVGRAAFGDTNAYLYADQADLVANRGIPGSPVDTFMLLYDECDRRTPLGADEFFVVSFDTVENERFVRYVVHVFGDGTILFFENGKLEHGDGGATRVHEIDGQHGAAGFGPSPDCGHNHLVVEYDIELEAAGGHSYSPDPAWWSAHASGGGGSTNPGTTCPRQVGPSSLGGSSPWAAGAVTRSGTDVDKDGLDHDTERRLATDPCNYDTDGDGLADSWEVEDPSVPGAGFDLDGNGTVDVPSKLVFGGGFDAPNPLRKDVYVEVDSYDCNVGGCPPFDPMVHGLNAQAKTDVERMFAGLDMSLHIVDDEHVTHTPNCDQPPALLRGGPNPAFGTRDQRALAFGDLIRAKELAFRYAVFGHSTLFDDDNPCATPGAVDLATTALFGSPGLPNYDNTPFGSAVIGGRDMVVSLSPLWICPSDTEVPNPALILNIGLTLPATPLFARICRSRSQFNGALFPARVIGRALPSIKKPYSRLLGVSEENGTTQLLGRTFAHLLGHLLGLSEAQVGNHPQQAQAYPPAQPYLLPDPYPGAASIKLGGDSDSPLFAIDSSASKLRFTPRIATGTVTEDTVDDNPIGEAGQIDSDGDGVIEDNDNCTGFDNPDQADLDGDGVGDACDPDIDGDGADNAADAHPVDTDDDGIDNVADTDDDGDGVLDGADDCALVPNAGQADVDGDGTGDACDDDADGDGAGDELELPTGSDRLDPASTPEFLGVGDSCSDGLDNDGDGAVDGADDGCIDSDGDTMPDSRDPCPSVADAGWADTDGDGVGNACDPDSDGDGVTDADERSAGSDPFHDASTPETRSVDGVCSDGVDNDMDGLTDADDPRCLLPSKLGPSVIRPGFDAVATPPNDDDTTGPVALGFQIAFGGQTFDETYVNNNGNLTFEGPLADFIPFDLTQAPDPIVAPFFADVDTREGAVARYGTGTVDGRPAFGVTWPGVGCYPRNTSLRNAFQAILVDRTDVAAGAFDIELDYDQLQWDQGQAPPCDTSGGTTRPPKRQRDAVGGAARAGYSDGTGNAGSSVELPGSGVSRGLLDDNEATGLVHAARDSSLPGRYVFHIRPPSPDRDGDGVGNEIDNCPEDTNAGQQDTGLIGVGDACRPERNTTAGFLQAGLDATTTARPTSTLLADAPTMLERLVEIVKFRVDAGLTSSPEQLTHNLVSSVVDLGLVSAADAPQLEADVLLRVLGPRTPPPPPPPPVIGPPLAAPPIGPTRDTTAPVLTRLYAAPRVFALGAGGLSATRVRYTLSEAAFVRIEVAKPKPGRRLGSACKAPSRQLARARPCTRYKVVTRLGQPGVTGQNARAFSGLVGRRPLAPGSYRITATAIDAAGNRSQPRNAHFRVRRP